MKESQQLFSVINVFCRQENWGSYHLNDSFAVTKLDNGRDQTRTGVWSQLSQCFKIPTCFTLLVSFLMPGSSQQPHICTPHIHFQWTLPLERFPLPEIMLSVAIFLNLITSVPGPRQVLWAQLHESFSSTLSFI